MRSSILALGGLCLLATTVATAGWFSKKKANKTDPNQTGENPSITAEPAAQPLVATDPTALWSQVLPVSHGPLPTGLANLSVQGCAACHSAVVEDWRASDHAAGRTDALLTATSAANDPACVQCHLPLKEQHRSLWRYDGPGGQRPVRFDNPGFDATLAQEGVTCAACHVREGRVLGAADPPAPSPHRGGWAAELDDARACAPCHQLTWEGADRPLYDTIGEYERSAYAPAGVGCTTCHLAEGTGHGMDLPLGQAISVLLSVPPAAVTRGAEPVGGTLTVQNTGAGHAVPTGSPFKGLRLTASIEGPGPRNRGRKQWMELLSTELGRTIGAEPPWVTTADTRLQAGEQRVWPLSLALPVDAPTGDYYLDVALWEIQGEETSESPAWSQRYPLPVQ